MKKILLLTLLSATTHIAFSQMSGNYNYSIGVRGYTMMQMPKVLNESNADYFTDAAFNGAMIKFNDNMISYRLSGTYYDKSKKFYNNCETCEAADGKLVDYSFKIGFEKNFNYSRLQPYFAVDLGYRYNRFSGDMENKNQLKARAVGENIHRVVASKSGMVISPVIGFKISPIEQFSIFAEGNLDFFYAYERQETIANDAENTRTFRKFNKAEFLLNPVSVGLQIHLGSNK